MLDEYDFFLAPEFIAVSPASPRDHSKLMTLEKGQISHHHFYELCELLPQNSLVILNNTKVIPARLLGNRLSGGKLELLLVKEQKLGVWECKVKNSAKVKIGEKISLAVGAFFGVLVEKLDTGLCVIEFEAPENLLQNLEAYGLPPLPPYIINKGTRNREQDLSDYQTNFATETGAVAAPTAGLHFTPELLKSLEKAGHETCTVTLHVGLGTFEPLKESQIAEKKLHSETYEITEETARIINQAKAEGRAIVTVGTTSLRAVESATLDGQIQAGKKDTNIFIYPPHEFAIPTHLITNFHLPASSLLMLVAAFCGQAEILEAYKVAMETNYRFYSFGDAQLITKAD
ncbi:MAG: tRNA preQ1(34) S-adenosylmethionine ribosyltransferase-isomerase QueA [SAR324 cluster bacterium]|nr:tRNA preQ1(34) S-adenosylmethionine ribosyltransferase-isomerase QueA [SAR324 cluster bacterium]